MMSGFVDEFWKRCSLADEAFQGVGNVRPFLESILQLVLSAPEARAEFVGCFIDIVHGRSRPWEAVNYCMRTLQWPEVHEAAVKLMKEHSDFRVKTVMTHILRAYGERPEDDFLY